MDRSYLKIFKRALALDDEALESIHGKLAENEYLTSNQKQFLHDLADIIRDERKELYDKWFG